MATKLAFALVGLVAPLCAWGWADTGHILVGEIARRTAPPAIVAKMNEVTSSFVDYFPEEVTRLPYSATFMDYVKRDTVLFDNYHFIDFPYVRTPEDAPAGVPQPESVNLLKALDIVYTSLKTKGAVTNIWGKGFSALMLAHLLGDMHQPLHAVSLFSKELNFLPPLGDMGGNKYLLTYTDETGMAYKQAHLLFDCVTGLWCSYMPHPLTPDFEAMIAQEADALMKDFPADSFTDEQLFPDISSPVAFAAAAKSWALESFDAAKAVYAELPAMHGTPSPAFITKWRRALRERIALAGYRLAYVIEAFDFSEIGPRPTPRPDDDDDHQVNEAWRAFAITFGVLSLGMMVVTYAVWKRANKIKNGLVNGAGETPYQSM